MPDDAQRRAVLERWYREYGDRVLAYLEHRTDFSSAQDILQEVFVIALRKSDSVPEPPLGWLLATARRLLANHRRGRRRADVFLSRMGAEAASEQDQSLAELRMLFATALAAVSGRDREVLTLSGWYGLTPAEAAQALGCSARTYAVRLHRARRRLAAQLHPAGPNGPVHTLLEALNG